MSIFIYDGPGVSQASFKQIEYAVRKYLPEYLVQNIGPKEVINDFWEEKAVIFILPGGADIPYTRALNGRGNQKIQNYVRNGGAFLGICAGSYYAGAFVDFAKDTDLEVQGERELSFFPGVVRGPVLAPYDYASQKGARAAQLIWSSTEEKLTLFYNGGGYFVGALSFPNTSVLAYYDEEKTLPGIIQCRVGDGVAILSGAHFEYDPSFLDLNDPYLKTVIPLLSVDNKRRELLLQRLFKQLLETKSKC